MILPTLRGVLSGIDADAVAYANAVATAGATITTNQRAAIHSFIRAEKLANRWGLHRRIYLPIWGVASANAIDLVSLTSGTWIGGVTHAAGYVQGNGSTGYMRDTQAPNQLLTVSSVNFGALVTQAASNRSSWMGAGVSGTALYHESGTDMFAAIWTANSSAYNGSYALSENTGIFTFTRNGNFISARRRRAAGVASIHTTTNTNSGFPSTSTCRMHYMVRAEESYEQRFLHSNARFGAWFMGLGLNDSNADAFASNLKTLWETCTGLTLP